MADGWIINVCRTCGRRAIWPFCEHRDLPVAPGKSWCVGVSVGPLDKQGRELAARAAGRRNQASS